MQKKTKIVLLGLLSLFCSEGLRAACITDQGPYEGEYGYALFPFYNSCEEDIYVSLCVKSYPAGSDRAVFNLYGGTAGGRNSLTLTNGLWKEFYSYRWLADGSVECPFYE